LVEKMLKKQIPFFAMICLLVCAAQSLAAQTKTITLGGKNGWSNLSVMDSVEFGTGRFGYESVLLSNDEHRVTSETDLLISFEDGNITDKIIRLEGQGLLPRLYFDKRELILPIVPLGFESSIKFKIKNEGYENEEISFQFESYPQCVLPIEFNWLEKNHTIGVFKNELKGEVKMLTNKPITFTTKLIFFDKEGQQFPITVAGT